MQTESQKIVKQANIIPSLQLGVQQEGGGVKSTGRHTVKFLSDKIVMGTEFQTGKERHEVEYLFEEKGQSKKYRVPVKDKKDEVHYFIQRMAEVEIGEEIILEMKRKGNKNYIDFQRTLEEPTPTSEVFKDDIPIVEDSIKEGDEIDVEEIDL